MADMKKRCEIIADARPDAVVSIHQNSYHQENVSGGQVFYYRNSVEGKRLAELLQERFSYVLGRGKHQTGQGQRQLLSAAARERAYCDCGADGKQAD